MENIFLKYFLFITLVSSVSFCDIGTYSKIIHKMDYKNSSKQLQEKMDFEYKNHSKLYEYIKDEELDKNKELELTVEVATIKVWLENFNNNYQPTNEELMKIYNKLQPKLPKEYKLSIIKVQYEASANKILKMFNGNENSKEKYEKFQDFVHKFTIDIKTKKNRGKLGWIKEKNLVESVKKSLENSKKDDIVVSFLEDDGWQILYVEDIKPVKLATFEESKEILVKIAKNRALKREIKKILN